ncbi:hypothetical protein ACFVIM_12195 [Streptomyces sp. NPDC057638]|uniref:hypothetical protein n=1 Tax=Streptomyces sp. NPDC057638 TaxID=3346190 RepID=UPI0036B40F31
MTSGCLRELIAHADDRGLAASGLGCLERCLPPHEIGAGALRGLWTAVAKEPQEWPDRLAAAQRELAADPVDGAPADTDTDTDAGIEGDGPDAATALVRELLAAAPTVWAAGPLRTWAEECSAAALTLHHRFDAGSGADGTGGAEPPEAAEVVEGCREGHPAGAGPLVTGELRRQIRTLEILADPELGTGLRPVLTVAAEGQRVLRAAVSRRARVRH